MTSSTDNLLDEPNQEIIQIIENHRSLTSSREIWNQNIKNLNHYRLFYTLLLTTIESILEKKFTIFDGLTTSNCCHGLTVFTVNLIQSLDIDTFNSVIEQSRKQVDQNQFNIDFIPDNLIDLTGLTLLNYITDLSEGKGRKTIPKKLKNLTPVNTNFCTKIVKELQKYFSNKVVANYQIYAENLETNDQICGLPMNIWSKYVSTDFLRISNRKILFAPSMFSLQIVLAYLAQKKIRIAIVNDLMSTDGKLRDRCVHFISGNHHNEFKILSSEEIKAIDPNEPLVVFGGFVKSDILTLGDLSQQMKNWLNRFPFLVHAGETHYPHFPAVKDDPNFNSSPIIPDEPQLQSLNLEYSKIKGTHALDPSFYFLTHIFPASFEELQNVQKKKNSLAIPLSIVFSPNKSPHSYHLQ